MIEQEEPEDSKKKDKKEKKEGAKTIGTMFRNLMSNHLQISALADRKAGLLVSINALIISIMTSFLVHEFATNPRLLIPTILLVSVCLLTITFSLLATRPTVKPHSFESNDVENSKLDLLFFGDYTQLSVEDYKLAMKKLMANEGGLEEKMLENIYAQGTIIKKKYRLLSVAYSIFIVGFPLAVISYLIILFIK